MGFLDFLADHAREYPHFHLRMQAEVTAHRRAGQGGWCTGPRPSDRAARRASRPRGGRRWTAFHRSGEGRTSGDGYRCADGCALDAGVQAPGDPSQLLGRIEAGQMLVMIDRGQYWQCAYLIPKGSVEILKQEGLAAFRSKLVGLASFPRRTRRGTSVLGRHQAADSGRRPAEAMV